MKKIPIIQTKELIDGFIEKLRADFEANISWLENTYPAAKVGVRENGKKYPQIYTNRQGLETISVEPDNSVKSFCFFETSSIPVDFEKRYANYKLSVVFWVNLLAINPTGTSDFTSTLIKEVLKRLNTFGCNNIIYETENVFSKYGLKETDNQFLMYPFSAFKINFTKLNKIYCN